MTDFKWSPEAVEAARRAGSALAMTERWSPVAAVRCVLSTAATVQPVVSLSEVRQWLAQYREHPPVDTGNSKQAGWVLDDLSAWLDEVERR